MAVFSSFRRNWLSKSSSIQRSHTFVTPSVISVCAAGRASLYMTTLATMMGLHIRIGTEDTPWKYPNSDERLKDNLEMFNMARDIAGLLGRKPASANDYRELVGKPTRD